MSTPASEPTRPILPEGYLAPENLVDPVDWAFVDRRLAAALNYWVATVRPDGRPHVMPVWGAWIDNRLYIEGSPDTVRHRNLAANPHVAVHLEDGAQAVILEGLAHRHSPPAPDLARRLSAQFSAKYAPQGYTPGPDAWDAGGLIMITPRKVFAWTDFIKDAARWVFSE